ncbi:unnamed protein product, partial [Ectocarpus sp. 13 AM-2016]
LLDLESIFFGLGEIFRDASLWELDDGFDGRMPKKLGRVGDMSPNGAFGRCLVYRIDVSDLLEDRSERARLFQELFAFRLCTKPRPRQDHLLSPVRVHTYASGQPLNGWDNLLEYSRLPYSVKF